MKKFTCCFLTAIFSVALFANIVYAGYQYYSAILPRYKGDVALVSGNKTTGYDNIFHRNILIGQQGDQYDQVDVWLDRYENSSWTRVSPNVPHYEGGFFTTPVADVDLLAGQLIRARAQNSDWVTVNVGIQGEIDLR